MQDVGDEVDHPVWSELGDRLELDPLGELIDSHQNMSKTPWCHSKGPIMSRLQQANGQKGGIVMRVWART
jgi:hypothetical protein